MQFLMCRTEAYHSLNKLMQLWPWSEDFMFTTRNFWQQYNSRFNLYRRFALLWSVLPYCSTHLLDVKDYMGYGILHMYVKSLEIFVTFSLFSKWSFLMWEQCCIMTIRRLQVFVFVISLVVVIIVKVNKESPPAVRTQGDLMLFISPFPSSEV